MPSHNKYIFRPALLVRNFSKIIKMSLKRLNVEKNIGYLFFRNPPLLQISTFSLGQKVCAYYEKSAYNECAYYGRAQYLAHSGIIIKEERKFCYVEF